jgi:hypothetical protein
MAMLPRRPFRANQRVGDNSSEWITSVQPTIQERTGRGSLVAWAFLVNLTAAANFLLAKNNRSKSACTDI